MKPQLDSNVVCDVSEKPSELNKEENQSGFGGLPAIDTGLLLDVKPEQMALEECSDENPTKTKEDLEIEWKCVNCSQVFSYQRRLKVHIGKNQCTELVCKTCGFKTFSKEFLVQHKQTKHEKLQYICDQCPFQATSQSSANWHMKYEHEHEKSTECKQCNASVLEGHT